MKFFTAILLLSASATSFADFRDLTKKIDDISSEIEKIKNYQSNGLSNSAFDDRLKSLEVERKQYQILLKDVRSRENKKNISKNFSLIDRPLIKDKILPTALRKDLQRIEQFEDESVPLEKRYELILAEINNIYEINSKLDDLEESGASQSVSVTKNENRLKLKELQSLKVKYELLILEAEKNDLADMKKNGVRLGVMFDAYYQWDFNRPKRVGNNQAEIPYKNYTNRHNDFTVNLMELNVFKSYKNLDFYADIDFGEQPEQNKSVTSDPVTNHIGQAFLRWRPKNVDNLAITAGKFYSHFGLEVPKNIENRTYSRPFYFYLVCPFWHEGISVTQSGIADNWGYGLYLYDKTDDRVDNDSDKTYGFQLNYSKDKFSAIYNFISGSEQNSNGPQVSSGTSGDLNKNGAKKTMHEAILTYNATEGVTFVLDGVMGVTNKYDSATGRDSIYQSIVGYMDLKLTHKNFLNFRYENFNDFTSGSAQNNLFTTSSNTAVRPPQLDSYTITNRYSVGNGSELRFEYRLDTSTKDIFPNSTGGFKKNQATVVLGWLYSI